MMRRLSQVLIILFFLFSADFSFAVTKIKIGVIVPLTGGLASRGQDINRLLPFLASSLNKISPEYAFDFIIEDGRCGAGNASVSAAQKLINLDKIDFLITGCSGETLQIVPLAEKNHIITFAVYSSNPEIKNFGDFLFRTFIDQDTSLKGYAREMRQRCHDKIAMITEENAFTLSYKNYFQTNAADALVLAEDLPADTSDYTPLLNKAKARSTECIFLNLMSDASLSNAVNQVKRLQLSQQLFSNVMAEAANFRKLTGSNGEDLYFVGTPDVQSQSAEFNQILADFIKAYPEGPSYEFLLRTTYDAAKALADAVVAVGKGPGKMQNFLYSYSAGGAMGKIEFDRNGDVKALGWVLRKTVADGRHEQVGIL